MSAAASLRIAIVGAGVSGLAAARALVDAGLRVDVFDMGENPGGRLATRDLSGAPWPGHIVDVGAAYFTVSEPEFEQQVQAWTSQGLAHKWSDTFAVVERGGTHAASGRLRWSARKGLRSLALAEVEALIATGKADIQFSHRVANVSIGVVGVTVDGEIYDAAILACPPAQALRILGDSTSDDFNQKLQVPWNPVISHTMVFNARTWTNHGLWFLNDSATLTTVCDDGARRGDGAAVLVAHSTPDVARAHFDDPESASALLTTEVRAAMDIEDEPSSTITKRWGLAQPQSVSAEDFAMDASRRLMVCGDAWCAPARIEGAWLSGRRAAQALLTNLGG